MSFTAEELDDIATHLAVTGEIDARYSYLGEGAATWDRFVTWQQSEGSANILHATLSLLADAHRTLAGALSGPVRVVDLGPGNAIPVRGLVERLRATGRLERYVGVDNSAEMLAIAEANLRTWLGPGTPLEFHRRDFTSGPLADLRGLSTLVLIVGGTLLNFADPVAVLRNARPVADVITLVARTDTVANRTFFRFGESEKGEDIPERYRLMLDRLGVSRECYEPEIGFDGTTRQRYLRIRLTASVTVAGRLALAAGSRVLLWRYYHRSPDELGEMVEDAGYSLLTERRSADGEYVLLAGVADRRSGT